MNRQDVTAALVRIREARRKWDIARAKFNSDVDTAMMRLINEAAANFMSAEDVSKYSGFTVKRVRAIMRENSLDPKRGRRLIARKAASTLEENALIMGIDPRDMDLMSLLAYLPAGKELRKSAAANGTNGADVLGEFLETTVTCSGCAAAAEADDDKALAALFRRVLTDEEMYVDVGNGDLILDGHLWNLTSAETEMVEKIVGVKDK